RLRRGALDLERADRSAPCVDRAVQRCSRRRRCGQLRARPRARSLDQGRRPQRRRQRRQRRRARDRPFADARDPRGSRHQHRARAGRRHLGRLRSRDAALRSRGPGRRRLDDRSGRADAAWRDFMAAAPEGLSSLAICWSIPPFPPFPPELHGTPIVAVAAAYCGSVEEGERVVQPLRELAQPLVDASGPWPWLGLQSGFDAIFPQGELRYWKSRSIAELSDEVIAEILELAGRRPTPLTDIVMWHHGGAMTRVGEAETSYSG